MITKAKERERKGMDAMNLRGVLSKGRSLEELSAAMVAGKVIGLIIRYDVALGVTKGERD
jgi:hypothetical protein